VTRELSVIVLASLAGSSLGCGDDDGRAPVDAGTMPPDAGSDAGSAGTDAGPECDVGEAPIDPPALTGSFVFYGGDGGTGVPVPTGGDPTGIWAFDAATFYVPEDRRDQLDADASHAEGEAWLEVGATEFRLSFFFDVRLETLVVGTVRRPTTYLALGTYTADGPTLMFDAECLDGRMSGGMLMISFSESEGRGQLFIDVDSTDGGDPTVMVLDGTRTAL
jgi:hypothetical protein